MNYSWTKEEIDCIIQYENLLNEYYIVPQDLKDETLLQEILLLEAKLLMINKYIVVCFRGSKQDILSFREYLDLEQKAFDREKITTFFPINFINESEYINHVTNFERDLENSQG
jgi:hypothetical protein